MKIYRNLTRKTWSIKFIVNGKEKVIGYAKEGYLSGAVCFKVSEAGRQRVLREGKKYVHAFVCGKVFEDEAGFTDWPGALWTRISYNPRKNESFVRLDTDETIFRAFQIYFHANGSVWARL